MPLVSGTQLGHYKIQSLIGMGGMGEVYRAVDTKLEREVAVKVLPAALATDPERLARFEREAKVLAQMNHPGIASIHGVEDCALIMELVPGPTLADRIKQGPIPAEEAEAILLQIADALEYAHERGVIHRDLKPANIKIDPEDKVKILDFGLAKALTDPAASIAGSPGDLTNSPTRTVGATVAGAILGTATYMAPEQARGKKVDKRADIWAYGVIAWEMLTGEHLFQGDDTVQVLSNVLQQPVDLERVPAKFRKLLGRCLDRNPKDRLRDIGEARFLLEEPQIINSAQAESLPHKPSTKSLWPVVAGVLSVAVLGLGYIAYRHTREETPRVQRFSVLPPENVSRKDYHNIPQISPDGRRIVMTMLTDGQASPSLWLRDLDSLAGRILQGTSGASFPFWSRDSRWVGFFADNKLKKIDVTGGPALTLCDTPQGRGGSWNQDDVIVYGRINSSLFRVPAAGGTPVALTEPDAAEGEFSHRWPWFLPDGRHFLYTARSGDAQKTHIYADAIDAKPRVKTRKEIVAADSNAVYASGYLLFVRERTLMAQPFDTSKLETAGDAVPIAEQVDYFSQQGLGHFSVSRNGTLVFTSGAGGGNKKQLTWFDRNGKSGGSVGMPADTSWSSISPDGSTVATDRADETGGHDIWLHDLARLTDTRFTFGPGANVFPGVVPGWQPDRVHDSGWQRRAPLREGVKRRRRGRGAG